MENPPKWDETEEVVVSKAKVPSWDDTEELPVKKKEPSAKSEPSTSDSKTPSPLLEKSGEDKSFTERIATNNLPQTFAKQQTKQKSDAEILAEKKAKATQKEGGFDLAKSTTDLIGGINRAITNAPSEIVKTGAELINYGGNKINKVFGIEETKIEDNPVYKLADSYSNWMDNNVYEDVDKESLPSQIGSGLGQAATMIATGGGSTVSKGLANASKVAKAIKSSVVPFSQVFNSEYEGMKDAGESEDVAFEQAIVNATATTPLEKLPIANLFTRYKKYIGSDLSKRALTASAQALEEGTTEGLQQVFSNLTNNQLVELDANTKEWNKDVGNSAEVGGYVGLILGTISSVAQGRLKGRKDGGVQVQEPTQQSATNTEGEKPIAFASKQQESDGKPASTEANKGATIESAVIEIGGETFEGKNHAEAILKAQQAGKDISQVDRQGEGMFKLSDGSIISREQAKEAFGADKAEMLITQDEAANKANDDYEKVKREFKREDIANKIASNDTGGIAQVPIEDVPLLVEERTNPTEDVLTVNPLQENITLTVPQPTITGAQEQEGADGVQAVSENVQEAGTADVPSVPVGKTTQKTELDARGKLDERAKSLGYTGIKQFNTQNVLNENLNAEEKQLLDDYSSHKASIDNEKDSSVIESMNDEDFGNWAKANDVQRDSNGYVNNQSDLDLAKKRIDILNKRGNTKQADIELKQLKGSTKKSDWTVDSWNERFDELLTQEEIDEINKERSDFNKKLNEVLNEPTKKQDVPVSVLDQSGATDSDTEKGTRKVEKTITTKRGFKGTTNEDLQKAYEKQGLHRYIKNQKEALDKAGNFLKEVGFDNAMDKLRNATDMRLMNKTMLWGKLMIEANQMLLDAKTETERQEALQRRAEITEWGSEHGLNMGEGASAFNAVYKDFEENGLDFGTDKLVEGAIKLWESENKKDGESVTIPNSLKEEFKELGEKIKAVNKELAEANDKLAEKEAHIAILELRDAEQKATNEKTIAAKRQAAKKKVNDGLSEMFGAFASITGGKLSAVDSDEKIIRGARKAIEGFMEEASITFEEAFNKLKEAVKSKGYNTDKLDEIRQNLESESTQSDKKESLFGLGNKKLRELAMKVEMGKDVTPEQQVKQYVELIKNEISETHEGITDREIRDEISGYGKVITQSKEDGQKELSKMKNLFRGVSQLEDIGNGEPPKKSGFQREPTDTDVRLIFRRVREALKTLPLDLETKEGLLKTAEQSYLKRLKNRIEDLKKENDTRIRVKKEKNQPITSKEITEAKDTIFLLEKEHDEIFGGDIANERIANTIKSRIQKIEEELASGEPKQQNATQTELSDDNKALKSELEVLKEIRESVFGANINNKDKAKNKQLMAKAEGLIEQLENGRKQKDGSKKSELNDEGIDIKKRIEVLQDVYNSVFKDEIKAEKEAKQNEYITKSLEEIIKKVKEELASGTKAIKSPSEQRVLSERNKALKSELENLSEIRDYVLSETKTKTPASKKNALEAKISRLINEIETGKQEVKAKPKSELTPEEKNLTDRIAILKDIHGKAFEEEIYLKKQEAKLKASKSALNKRITDLEKKIATNDFSKKEKPKQPFDEEKRKLILKKEKLVEEFNVASAKYAREHRTAGKKKVDAAIETTMALQAMKTAFDLGLAGVQLIPLLSRSVLSDIANARLSGDKSRTIKALGNAFKSFASTEYAQKKLDEIRTDPYFDKAKKSQLSLIGVSQEVNEFQNEVIDDFMEKAVEKITRSKKVAEIVNNKAFTRFNTTLGNELRFGTFKKAAIAAEMLGYDIETNKKEFKDIAGTVNSFSGRAKMKGLTDNDIARVALFSPKNWASMIKTATPIGLFSFAKMKGDKTIENGVLLNSPARREAARTLLAMTTAGVSMTLLAAMKYNDDDDDDTWVNLIDPTRSDFMKVSTKLKDGSVVTSDFFGGRLSMIIAQARFIASWRGNEQTSLSGKKRINTPIDVLAEHSGNKLSPLFGTTKAYLSDRYRAVKGEKEKVKTDQYTKKPVDHIERLFGTVSPMAPTDIYHIMKNDPELFEGMNTILVMGGLANVNEKVEGKDETTNPYLDIKKKGKSK